jgi:hypothetical protein
LVRPEASSLMYIRQAKKPLRFYSEMWTKLGLHCVQVFAWRLKESVFSRD